MCWAHAGCAIEVMEKDKAQELIDLFDEIESLQQESARIMKIEQIVDYLKSYDGRELKIMEVCGTHTASIFRKWYKEPDLT